MELKGLQKNKNYIITHHEISIILVPSAKLAVISEIEGEASLTKDFLTYHLLCIIIENELTNSSYELSLKSILFLMCIQL